MELTVVKGQLATKEKNEEELVTQLQDRNDRVRQFEDNYKLAKIENELLKAQVSALLEGGKVLVLISMLELKSLFEIIKQGRLNNKQCFREMQSDTQ